MTKLIRKQVSIIIVMLLAFSVLGVVNAPYAQAADVKLNVVAMGDSYTSGTGGLDYFGTNGCYKSHNSYGELLAERIGGGIDVSYQNLACHGAVVSDLYGQLSQLTERQRVAVDLVLLTIGGNDGGYESIVRKCLIQVIDSVSGCVDALNAGYDKINTIESQLRRALQEIATVLPDARVILVGYPYPISNDSTSCDYTISNAGIEFKAGPAVRELADKLESVQKSAVTYAQSIFGSQVQFVSTKNHFAGHENCGQKSNWMRGILDTPILQEWWHPNLEGYTAIANYLYNSGVHHGQEDVFLYSNLPFACGAVVPFASTYSMMSNGSHTWSHGQAIDLPMPNGTTIVAASSGTARVRYSDGLGYYVDISGSDGVLHRTAHMQSSGLVRDASYVNQGQPIGKVGMTGNTTGPHVHYEQHVSGGMRPVRLDGPTLEWGPDLDGTGFRKTNHSLESANCSNNSSTTTASDVSTEELFIYKDSTGRRVIHDVRTDASQLLISDGNWKSGWDIIVDLEIDGDSSSEVLFYDAQATATRGSANIYNTTSSGLGDRIWTSAWSSIWTHIVPVDLDGDRRDELIVYSANNGRYYIFDVHANGSNTVISNGTWSVGWQSIVPVQLGTGGEEVLFYKPGTTRGVAKIYSISNTGSMALLNQINWVNGWEFIVPIDMDGDGNDELVLYNPVNGKYFFLDMNTSASPRVLQEGTWTKGWDIITAIEFDGTRGGELLFYDNDATTTRGRVKFYDVSTNGLSGPKQTFEWSKGWTIILPVQLPSR